MKLGTFGLIFLALFSLAGCGSFATADQLRNQEVIDGCSKNEVDAYLGKVDKVMSETGAVVAQIQETKELSEMNDIGDKFNSISMDVFMWEIPECTREIQADLLVLLSNLELAVRAVANEDWEDFDRRYDTYAIASEQMNIKIENLLTRFR